MDSPNYVYDWFKRHGMDGSVNTREKLFRLPGPTIKKLTPEQETLLLNYLKKLSQENQ